MQSAYHHEDLENNGKDYIVLFKDVFQRKWV